MEKELRQDDDQKSVQEKSNFEMQYAEGSRRAASKPRRKTDNAVGEESNVAIDEDGRNNNVLPKSADKTEDGAATGLKLYDGPLEEQLKERPFPFGDHVLNLITMHIKDGFILDS